MWDNAADAAMRLNGSVVKYSGRAVTIHEVQPNMEITFSFLDTGEPARAAIKDELWDFKPVPVGYVNYNGQAVFVSRAPIRKWKQGLHRDNVMIERGDVHNSVIHTPEFSNTVLGNFPKFEQCLEDLNLKKVNEIAFSRLYALSRSAIGLFWLEYRGQKVGWLEQGKPVLGEDYEYLDEELLEAIG